MPWKSSIDERGQRPVELQAIGLSPVIGLGDGAVGAG